MPRNEGTVDRVIRLLIAIGLAFWASQVGFGSTLGIVLTIVAVIVLFTAATGFCALYKLVGINTCPANRRA